MANSKLVIVEGPQGVGKTTITDFIRHTMKYTNLYRLSGTSDSTKAGLEKATKMYTDLQEYIKTLENLGINLLFDRTFFSEENYCRLGYKEYSFTEVYNKLLKSLSEMDFDIYYITLYLKDENLYKKRLERKDKANLSYAKFAIEKSVEQQKMYLQMADEIKEKYSTKIKVYKIENSRPIEEVEKEIKEILDI